MNFKSWTGHMNESIQNDEMDRILDKISSGTTLSDRDGKIGIEIQSVHNNFADESCYVILKNGQKIELTDNYLYNMIYNIKKDEYSLESQDEYYEKIPVKDENN